MAANQIFPSGNNYWQGCDVGICTAASFAWARMRLRGPVGSLQALGDPHLLNIQMATLRKLDNNPQQQTETANLEMAHPNDLVVNGAEDALNRARDNAGMAVIFWSTHHTMALYYCGGGPGAGEVFDFFDVERGAYHGTRADILQEIAHSGGGIVGARVVRLPD
jgi:hypothetical protein